MKNLKFYEASIKALDVTYNGRMKNGIEEHFVKDAYFYLDGKDFMEVESGKLFLDRTETLDLMDCKRSLSCYKDYIDLHFVWQFIDTDNLEKVTDESLIEKLVDQINKREEMEKEKKKSLFDRLKKAKKKSHK